MAAALFCGCDKEDDPRIDPVAFFTSLKHADIADAQSLYVASGVATRGGGEAADVQTLYKITFNGETQKVEFVDESGKPTDVKTNYVMNLSDKFLVIDVLITEPANDAHIHDLVMEYAFIVRKSDGAMFAPGFSSTHDVPMPYVMRFFHQGWIGGDVPAAIADKAWRLQTDGNNDVYFPAGGIAKIYDDATGNVFVEELVSAEMWPQDYYHHFDYLDYTVNENGDIWMNDFGRTYFYRLSSGLFIRGGNDNWKCSGGYPFTLPGNPKSFYRIDMDAAYDNQTWGKNKWVLYKYTVQQNTLIEEPCVSGYYDYEYSGNQYNIGYDAVRLQDCVVAFTDLGIFVINGETDVRFFEVKFPERPEDRPYLHSDKYVYAPDNQGNILRFDPTTGTVSPVYTNTRYEIRNLRLFADDLMQFSAFDLQTGATVIVEVDNGQERIIDMIDGRTVIQMERIN